MQKVSKYNMSKAFGKTHKQANKHTKRCSTSWAPEMAGGGTSHPAGQRPHPRRNRHGWRAEQAGLGVSRSCPTQQHLHSYSHCYPLLRSPTPPGEGNHGGPAAWLGPTSHPLIQAGTCSLPPPPDFLLDRYMTPQVCEPVSEETHDIWPSLGPPWGKAVCFGPTRCCVCRGHPAGSAALQKPHRAGVAGRGSGNRKTHSIHRNPKAGPILGGQGAGSRRLPLSLEGTRHLERGLQLQQRLMARP